MTLRPVWRPLPLLGVGLILTALSGSAQSVSETHQKAAAAYAKLALGFEENQGQFPTNVRFAGRNPGFTLSLTQNEAWMTVDGAAASLGFAGSSAVMPEGIEPLTSVSNYLIGSDASKWRTGVRQYGKVVYREIYPGIDALYYGDGRNLEFDLNVHPDADTQSIRLAYSGVTALRISDGGEVVFSLGGREIVQHKPKAYQLEPGGARVPVSVAYRIVGGVKEVALDVAAYDRSRLLVIDPVLEYGTFFGGSGFDGANALAVDSSGNAYITGYTESANLPPSPTKPLQGALTGQANAFVAKINATGSALVYTTYLGGKGEDQGTGIAIDASGNAYVSGLTSSTNFPILVTGEGNTLSTSYAGGAYDGFVSALNASGSGLIFSGYLGGPGEDVANSLTIDANANIYVTGYSNSTVITGINSISSQSYNAGGYDAFITKLANKGGIIFFCTFFGGSGDDEPNAIALDSSGNAYIAGGTTSPFLPLSSTSLQGSEDVFMAKFAAATGAILSVLDFGGSSIQIAYGITLDSSNLIYLTGTTNSINFPTVNPYQSTIGGGYDAFLVQLTPSISTHLSCQCTVTLSTYLGGSGSDIGWALVVTGNGGITIAGYTDSSNFLPSLPARPFSGPNTFVAQFSVTGTTLAGIGPGSFAPVFSAYFGAFCADNPVSMALKPGTSQVFIAGYANAAFVFPSSPTAPLFPYAGGASDAFVAKLGQANLSISIGTIGPYLGTNTPGTSALVAGTAALIPITVSNTGPDSAAYVTAMLQLPPGVTFIGCQSITVSTISGTALLGQAVAAGVSSAPASCSASGSTVTITAPSLGSESTLTAQVLVSTAASLKNMNLPFSADVQSQTPNSNANNNATSGSVQTSPVQAFTVTTMNNSGAIDFGSVPVGQSPTQTVTLTAAANQTVTFKFTLTSPNVPNVFSLMLNGNQVTLAGGATSSASEPISVQFAPQTADPESGSLGISCSVGGMTQGIVPFQLAGQGIPANITTKVSSVENAEGGAPAISPNTWIEIDGSALAPVGDSRIWKTSDFANNQLPMNLDGVSVTVNGKAAYVYYISPTQVNILTPPDALPSGTVPVVVTNNGSVSAPFNAQAQSISPSFFVYTGTTYAAAEHTNGSLIGSASLFPGSSTPAQPGETIQLYANGFGPTFQPVVSGSESQGGTLSPPPAVTIGGVTAIVTYAGLISPGLFQINVTVPSLGNGDQPLSATYNGQRTQSGVLITVQQ